MRDSSKMLTPAGILAWFLVGLPVLVADTDPTLFRIWLTGWLSLGAATFFPQRFFNASVVVQVASITAMVSTLCNGFEGALLVIIAARGGSRWPLRSGLGIIIMQTMLMCVAIALHWSPRPAIMVALPYLGFQLFAFLTVRAMRQQSELAARLFETQQRLQEQSRLDERLRLADELHDALGHELSAISLHLELASHQTSGAAQQSVQIARERTRKILGEVKSIVGALKTPVVTELHTALESLGDGLPRPTVHVAIDDVEPSEASAHALYRCAQEIVTNAIRHSGAANLWLQVAQRGDELELLARDDGSGGDADVLPHSLVDRVQRLGGSVSMHDATGSGYGVMIRIPVAAQ